MSTMAAPAPDDFAPTEFADPLASRAEPLYADAASVDPVDAKLAARLEDLFARSAPGPVPALPEDVRRFVARGEARPPLHRWRIVDGNVLERWEAIEEPIRSTDLATIALLAGQDRIRGWWVVRLPLPYDARVAKLEIVGDRVVARDGFGREIAPATRSGDDLREHVLSLQLAPEDDATYNGYYPTLPGNDVAHYDPRPWHRTHGEKGRFRTDMAEHQGGEVIYGQPDEDGVRHPLRGGREIRRGRAEHREATKDMIHVDAGFQKHHDRLAAEQKEQRRQENRLRIERTLRAGPEVPNDV